MGFIAGALAPLGFLAGYWLYYTGRLSPPELAIRQAGLFRSFQPEAFIAMALRPTRGLLLFFPVAAFGFWGAWRAGARALSAWLAAGSLATLIFLSHYANWTAGMTFGPRYLSGAALALAFVCADLEKAILSRPRLLSAWAAAGTFGLLVHGLGAYLRWPGSYGVNVQRAQVWDWAQHPAAFLFNASGGLGGLPPAGRWLVGLTILAAFGRLGVRVRRRLSAS